MTYLNGIQEYGKGQVNKNVYLQEDNETRSRDNRQIAHHLA